MLLVTGGAGFIGSNVVASLNEAGRTDIVVNDVLGTDDKWRNLAKRQLADVVPPADLFALARRPQARRRHPSRRHLRHHRDRRRPRDREQFPPLAAAARLVHRRRARRSSMPPRPRPTATARDGFDDDWSPAALQRLKPMNLYGWSKHLFDLAVVERVVQKEKLPPQWAGLKFFNVFGPNEYHKGEMMSLVAKRFDDAKAGKPVRLFKSHRAGIARRRAAARFHLCRRCGRGGALAAGDAVGVRHLQCRHRQGAQLPRPDRGACSAALGREPDDRIRRHAGRRSATSTSISRRPRSITCAAPATTPASPRWRTASTRYVTQFLDTADRYR